MVDKVKILSNFDIDNNILDCSTDENLSDFSLSDSSSENGDFKECNFDAIKKSESQHTFLQIGDGDSIRLNQNDNITAYQNKTVDEPDEKIDSPSCDAGQPTDTSDLQSSMDNKEMQNDKLTEEVDKLDLMIQRKDDDLKKYEDSISINFGEDDFRNDEFSRLEQSLVSNYEQYLNSPKSVDLESNNILETAKSPEAVKEIGKCFSGKDMKSPDDKRFQNLQEEINLLNILMYEAENQTEKCGSLYNSFTNEINNNLAYSKTGVVDDCGDSSVSLADGKFDAVSVKSEMLFSDYGKSESNYDLSESQDRPKESDKNRFIEEDVKSVSSVRTSSVKSTLSTEKLCGDCEETAVSKDNEIKDKINISNLTIDERVVLLWNQIIRLKCSLKNLQLNLKEQQMETLMQINEFLINQNVNMKEVNHAQTIRNRNIDTPKRKLHENFSDTSLIFTENNRVRENIALNNLKIALIECNLLSSTASSLVNSIPMYEKSELNSSKSTITLVNSNSSCCCEKIKNSLACSCPAMPSDDSGYRSRCSLETIKCAKENNRNNRLVFIDNPDEIMTDRKVKSNEEIGSKYRDTKYCHSEVCLDPISPRACI